MPSSPGLDLVPELGMVPTPALVAYARLLALPGAELEQTVARELADNPALVLDDMPACGGCGLPANPPCPYCRAPAARSPIPRPDDPHRPPTAAALAARVDWAEAVLRDLRLVLPGRDAAVAAVVVGSLDDRGYLTEHAAELALMARADVATVERVVAALRGTGPPGVGARDLRDCILLQIDRLAARGAENLVARAVVSDHLEALARGATGSIARQLGVPAEEVAAARAFIRREVVPRPAAHGECAQHDAAITAVRPDVAVVEQAGRPGTFGVDVLEERRLPVRVDPSFRRIARTDSTVSALVSRGDFFLARLRERWTTMRRITEYVAGQRPDLVAGAPTAGGQRLTRAEVAAGLGLNPSTVSRATADRFVLLPSRRVLPYAAFFDGSLGVRSQLQAIIAAESRPLSDAELCERLRRSGHFVARRTVAKYRSRLRVLPSTYR